MRREVERAVEDVAEAWTNPGRYPPLHRAEQERLRRNMPVLARALDRLVDKLEKY